MDRTCEDGRIAYAGDGCAKQLGADRELTYLEKTVQDLRTDHKFLTVILERVQGIDAKVNGPRPVPTCATEAPTAPGTLAELSDTERDIRTTIDAISDALGNLQSVL
jgi:hypothetical protein